MLPNRPLEITAFLEINGLANAVLEAFEADFSPRRYARLSRAEGQTAILMDADANQKTPLFVALAKILRQTGVHAPEIYAAQPERGLALVEDLGTRNIGALLDTGAAALPYFLRATEVLAQLHRAFKPADVKDLGLPSYSAPFFAEQAALCLDKFIPFEKQRDATETERADFHAAWVAALRPVEILPQSLLLRDFMPDNLMDMPNGEIGVVDFQDAGLGPTTYDLASLCEEVRRDGGAALLPQVLAHYKQVSGTTASLDDLTRACTLLSAQRHTRILGIIANVVMTHDRRDKLAFLPRVKAHLAKLLADPALLPVRDVMRQLKIMPD